MRDAESAPPAEDIERELFGSHRPRELFHRVGCWHSHPVAQDRPSRADMEVWVERSKATEGMSYCSVIAFPSPDSG